MPPGFRSLGGYAMTRISRDEMLMGVAQVMALRATCNRLHVGAVISRQGRVISTGYNGAPSGLPHCSTETCNVEHPCTTTSHAESGAIAHAARHGIALDGATLHVTACPCLGCAKLIINSGIKRVVYLTPYRKVDGLELLGLAGIEVEYYGQT